MHGVPSDDDCDEPVNGEPELGEESSEPSPPRGRVRLRQVMNSVAEDEDDAGEDGHCVRSEDEEVLGWLRFKQRSMALLHHLFSLLFSLFKSSCCSITGKRVVRN